MASFETSLLLVKPDGVAKGLVDIIRPMLMARGLVIKEEVAKTLKPGTVKSLYWDISDVRHRDYFPELVEFMSSKPIHIFVVYGFDAVKLVRSIIGKRVPTSGLRAQYAESIIKNVAHGPHTVARAERERKLLLGDETVRQVFVIGGMTVAKKFNSFYEYSRYPVQNMRPKNGAYMFMFPDDIKILDYFIYKMREIIPYPKNMYDILKNGSLDSPTFNKDGIHSDKIFRNDNINFK